MNDVVLIVLFFIGWIVLQRVVFPKLGVPT